MKPFGDYIKIKRIPKETKGKIITSLEGVAPVLEADEGILVAPISLSIDPASPGTDWLSAGVKVLFTNPILEKKEGKDTFVYVHRKYLIAYGR